MTIYCNTKYITIILRIRKDNIASHCLWWSTPSGIILQLLLRLNVCDFQGIRHHVILVLYCVDGDSNMHLNLVHAKNCWFQIWWKPSWWESWTFWTRRTVSRSPATNTLRSLSTANIKTTSGWQWDAFSCVVPSTPHTPPSQLLSVLLLLLFFFCSLSCFCHRRRCCSCSCFLSCILLLFLIVFQVLLCVQGEM